MRTLRSLLVVLVIGLLAGPASATAASPAPEPKITNGQDASAGEYPYMVGLLFASVADRFEAQFCGGSLVASDWVLTAAHCLVDDLGAVTAPADLNVLVGSIDLSAADGERLGTAQVVVHPGYDSATSLNDIALVQLSSPATLGSPITYAGAGDVALEAAGSIVTLTGWGGLTTDQDAQTYAILLQEATMPIIDAASCAIDGFDPTGMLCAGAPEQDADGGIDACQGDSGGPLVATSGGSPVQIGLVSFGPTCGFTPTAYTRVSAYADFVDQTLGGVAPPLEHVTRIAGSSRYATAAALATARWATGLPVAFVVTGANYPDALAAAPAAAVMGGPVLLTQRDTLPAETAAALQTLAPAQIIVVGGTGAVSDSVAAQLASFATSGSVTRVAGVDRYSTAVQLSQLAFPAPLALTDVSGAVYLASGSGFPDALAGAALAAHFGGPLLLTGRDSLAPVTAQEIARLLGLDQGVPLVNGGVVVFGGTAAVSDQVLVELGLLGITQDGLLRMAGNDRYETSAFIAQVAATDLTTGETTTGGEIVLATGTNFPDGLVAGSLGEPLLLVPPSAIPAVTADAISALAPSQALVMGGTGAVSDVLADIIDGLLSGAVG